LISKPIPPFNGLTNLVMATCCIMDGVARTLMLGSNFYIYKTKGFVFEIKKSDLVGVQLKLVTLFIKLS
jgi:hypothetical protein